MNRSSLIDTGTPLSYVSRQWRQAANFLGASPKTIQGNWNDTLDNHFESFRDECLFNSILVNRLIKYAKTNPNGGTGIIL